MMNRLLALFLRANRLYPALDRSQAIIEFRPSGKIIRANKNFLGAVGYSAREIVGNHHSMFVDPAERDSAEYREFWEKLRSGTFHSGEFRRVNKQGDDVWIQATYNPVFDIFGNVSRVVKFASDITEQKVKSIKDAGKLDAVDRSQAVIEFEMDGTIKWANSNFLAGMGGYKLDEIVGQHHRMFVEPEYGNSPEYRQFWDDLGKGKFKSAEFKRISKGGMTVWIQAIYNPIFDPSGKPLGVVKFATDITDQVLAREEARTLSLVANETDNSVVITDAEGYIEYVNSGFTRLTGYSESEAKGQKPKDLVQGRDTDPATVERIRTQLTAGRPMYEEILNYTKSGEPYWISLAINPIRNAAGKIERFVSIQANITATKLDSLAFDTRLKAIGSANAFVEWDAAGHQVEQNERHLELTNGSRQSVALGSILDEISLDAVKDGAVVRREIQWPTSSDQQLWFDGVFAATRNIEGDVERIIMIGADISARRSVVDEAMEALNGVIESSSQISKIVKSLDQIANQTNLLSLNAAVEAAHAGEAGAGFSVVSKEIGALAARSTKEAKDIAALANRSQTQVQGLSQTLHQLGEDANGDAKSSAAAPALPGAKAA